MTTNASRPAIAERLREDAETHIARISIDELEARPADEVSRGAGNPRRRALIAAAAVVAAVAVTVPLVNDRGETETVVDPRSEDPFGQSDAADSAIDTLAGRSFDASEITSEAASGIAEGTLVSITFDAASLQLTTGCNSIGAGYAIVDTTLRVENIVQTQIGCPGAVGDQEATLRDLLEASPTVELTDGGLVLSSTTTRVTFVEAAAVQGPAGVLWEPSELRRDGEVIDVSAVTMWISLETESVLTAEADLRVFDGCDDHSLPVEYSDGGSGGAITGDAEIQIGGEGRLPTCDAGAGDVVDALLAGGAATLDFDGDTLRYETEAGVIVFERIATTLADG